MGIVNRRNAFLGWVALKFGKRFARKKVKSGSRRFGRGGGK